MNHQPKKQTNKQLIYITRWQELIDVERNRRQKVLLAAKNKLAHAKDSPALLANCQERGLRGKHCGA
jgi:hypothetical protein